MKKKLLSLEIISLVIVIIVVILGAGWYLFVDHNKKYEKFSELHNFSIQPTLIEENDNLYVQWETDKPINEDVWIDVGYDGFIYAGTKIYNHEISDVYYNKMVNGKYQHRFLASWSMKDQKDVIQFQIANEKKDITSNIFTLDYKSKTLW